MSAQLFFVALTAFAWGVAWRELIQAIKRHNQMRRYNRQLEKQERKIAMVIQLRREGRWLEDADIDE